MAALAYLIPPLTGLWVFLRGDDVPTRAHGFQSIVLGFLWPLALYAGSWITPGATQLVMLFFGIAWLALLLSAGLGRGVLVPAVVERLERESSTGEP
jgi:uncharacterized membrane protein